MQKVSAGQQAGLHLQRKPEVRLFPAGFPNKARWSHADDGQCSFPDGEGLAKHVGTAPEASLPVVVTNDGIGRRVAVVGGCEDPAHRGGYAENLKKSTRYQ